MNRRALEAIVRKDLGVVLRSKPVVLPLVLLPAILVVVLPLVLIGVGYALDGVGQEEEVNRLLGKMPAAIARELDGLPQAHKFLLYALTYLVAPLYLIIPVMTGSVIAADSFAGEKERRTLEALLFTPVTDQELFVGKVLPAWIASTAVSLGSFVLYALVANLGAWPMLGRPVLPNATWLVLVLFVAPAFAGLGVAATVFISARVRGFQEATQLGAAVVIPVVALVAAQVSGALALSVPLTALMGLGLWLIDGLLLWLGGRVFTRPRLLPKL